MFRNFHPKAEEQALSNSYLDLARTVLLRERRPLTARKILEEAILAAVVPSHLYGNTPHKTLHARLSEDILRNRQRSAFFRTSAGEFFLRELINDQTLKQEYRQEYRAPRRQIKKREAPVLAFPRDLWLRYFESSTCLELKDFNSIITSFGPNYIPPNELTSEASYLPVHSFLIAHKANSILSYVFGRLNAASDPLEEVRSIGFGGYVHETDQDISYESLWGILESGISTFCHGTGLTYELAEHARYTGALKPRYCKLSTDRFGTQALFFIIDFNCPPEFDPSGQNLTIRGLKWINQRSRPNSLSRYDPLSQEMLSAEEETRLSPFAMPT